MSESKLSNIDPWQTVYVVALTVLSGAAARLLFQGQSVAVSVIAGAAGAALGVLLNAILNNRSGALKAAVFVVVIIGFLNGIRTINKFHSDEYLVTKQWNTVKIDCVSFEYPLEFHLFDETDSEGSIKMQSYMNDEGTRLAMYMNYDIYENTPAMEASFLGAISNSLESVSASDFEWVTSDKTDCTLSGIYKFKIDNKELNGFSFIYNKGNHFELIQLMGYSKNFSEDYLKKVKESIRY